MKILITGHRGYIGDIMCSYFSSSHQIMGYDIQDGFDILDYEQLLECFADFRPDIVIHLAAISSSGAGAKNGERAHCWKTNVHGTKNIINLCKRYGTHLIFASSCAVYGNSYSLAYEDGPLRPISLYGCTKLMDEMLIEKYLTKYTILRLFNVMGGPTPLYNGRLMDGLLQGKLVLFDEGNNIRDYIHPLDVCHLVDMVISHTVYGVFNIASGVGTPTSTVIDFYIQYTRNKVDIKYGNKRITDPHCIVGSNKKLRIHFNWKPQYTVLDMVRSSTVRK